MGACVLTSLLETQNVLLEVGAARGHHDLEAKMLGKCLAHLRCLQRELSRGDEHEGWHHPN